MHLGQACLFYYEYLFGEFNMKNLSIISLAIIGLFTAAAVHSVTLQKGGNFTISVDENTWNPNKVENWIEQDGGYESGFQLIEDPGYELAIFMADIHDYNNKVNNDTEKSYKPPANTKGFIEWVKKSGSFNQNDLVISDPTERNGFVYINAKKKREDGSIEFAANFGIRTNDQTVIFIFHIYQIQGSNDQVPYSDETFNIEYEKVLDGFGIEENTTTTDLSKNDETGMYVIDFPNSFSLPINKEKWELVANDLEKEAVQVKRRYNLKKDSGYRMDIMVSPATEKDKEELSKPEVFFDAITQGLKEQGMPPVYSKVKHRNGISYISGIVRDKENQVLLAFHLAYFVNDEYFLFLGHSFELKLSDGELPFDSDFFTAQFEEIVDNFRLYTPVKPAENKKEKTDK